MAKQAEFVNRGLSNGSNTISIKKFLTPNMPEETELDNPYQMTLITGQENKIEQSDQKGSPAQMKEWSILSNHGKYITSNESKTFNNLNIDQLNHQQDANLYRDFLEKESLNAHVNFGGSPDKLKSEYLDVYEGVYVEIVSSDRFDEDACRLKHYVSRTDRHDQR